MINIPVDEIKNNLDGLANNLLDALESDNQTKVLIAQQAFTNMIATVWNAAEEIEINSKNKAILRLVVGWATDELPKQISDPANNTEVKRQSKIFQRSLMLFNHIS